MKEPKIVWPKQSEIDEIVAATNLSQSAMEKEIRDSIFRAEKMARVGLDHIYTVTELPKSAWEDRWQDNDVLVRWFGVINKANHAKDVERRLGNVWETIASKQLTIKVQHEFPKEERHAQHVTWFWGPKKFQVAAKWFDLELEDQAPVVIHELLHEWFADQKLDGEPVYGAELAMGLASESPRDARQSPENYEQYCREMYGQTERDDVVFDAWAPIGGYFPAEAPVSVVLRKTDHLDAFVTGNNGVVYTSWSKEGDWSGQGNDWLNIGGVFPSGAPVSAISRTSNDLDLFIVGNNGVAYTSSWSSSTGVWSGQGNRWTPIGGSFPICVTVSVVARTPNHLDLFATGKDGHVYSSAWQTGKDWSGRGGKWWDLGGVFPPGAPVAAITRNSGSIDLFVTGNNGVVYTSNWTATAGWSGVGNRWNPIGGVFPPAAPLSVVARSPDILDLFITGKDGVVYSSSKRDGGEWSGIGNRWWSLGQIYPHATPVSGGVTGAPVFAVSRTPSSIDLFVAAANGGIYSSRWSTSTGWLDSDTGWEFVGKLEPSAAPAGTTVSGVTRSTSEVELLVTAKNGIVHFRRFDR